MRIKRITALLLTVVMLLGLMTGFAQAADSEEEALGEIQIYNGGESLSCLAVNGRVQTLNYVYYKYPSAQGYTKEIPAYCVNPTDDGVPQMVPVGQSIKYIAAERASDPKVMGIVANGYPTKSLGELGLQSKVEGYYATKIALWCYIIPGWDISGVTVNPNLSGAAKTQAERVLAAAQKIYKNGSWWNTIPNAGLTTTADQEYAYPVTIDGVEYKQQIITVHSETWVCNYEVQVAFADPGAVPEGTRIVNLDNEDISVVTTTNTGKGYDGQFKVLYPADSVQGESGSVQFTLRADVYRYGVYYASCAEVDKYGNIQNYICDTDPTRGVGVSAISKYSADEVPEEPDTALKIVKVESGTETPLAGAVFELKGPDGDTLGSFSTGTDGTVLIPLTQSGNYTVTEVTPPKDHLLSENPTQTVTVSYGKVSTVTFANDPYGSLRVEKISDTGDGLEGVTIQIKHIESGKTYTQKTTAGGAAFFDQLLPGAYEVREIAGIEGWEPDTETVQTVTVTTGDTAVVTMENKELPGLRITKYERGSMKVLPNVSFEIFRDNESLGIFQTDAMGQILLTNCQPGTYRAEERDTGGDSHVLDTTPQEVELKAGDGIKDLVFFNERLPGIHLIKVDSSDLSKPIANARFRIEAVDGSWGPEEYTTSESGMIDLSKLPVGSYVVTELECSGFVVDDAQRIIHLDGGEQAQFVFTNSKLPSLHLYKESTDGTPLGGVTFRLTRIEDGSRYMDRTTSSTGEITWDGLEPGVYSLQEVSTVSDHILDSTEYHVQLFPGKDSTICLQNSKRPNIIIHKHDADSGTPVEGTVFLVKTADGHSVAEVTTGPDGTAKVPNLLPGVYEISEKFVPDPYLLDAPSQLVTLYADRDRDVYFVNHKRPNVIIQKENSITHDFVESAEFKITWASSQTETGDLRDLGTFRTDEAGQIVLEGIEDGWLKITETKPAPGYQLPEDPTVEVYVKAGENKTITITNTPLSALVVYKRDSISGEGLSNCRFQLRYLGGDTSGTGGTVIGTYTTSSNGSFVVTGLKQGYYICEELESDSGHVIDTAPQSFYISGKDQDIVTLHFSNSPKGNLIVQKVDSTDGKPLEGAEFFITDSSGAVIGESNGKFVSDSKGQICISNIKPGTTLVVTETAAPDGYELDPTPQTIQIAAGQTHTLTFKNTPRGGLQLIKVNASDTSERIPNVKFEIHKLDGALVGTYTTGTTGTFYAPLEAGSFYAVEVSCPKDFKLDDTPHYFEVEDGKTTTLTVENTPFSGILIHKIDEATGKGIYGVSFLLYDSKHNPIGEYQSDQRGYVYIEGLEPGRFYIRELENEGYIVDDQLKTVYVRAGETTEITWKNTAIRGQIQIYKTSEDYNPTNGWAAGTPLPDTVFEIYSRSGNLVDTVKTNKNGVAISEPLPLGRYWLVESQASLHYSLDRTPLEVEIEFEGQIVRVALTNKSLQTGVAIKKTGYVEVMAGQQIRYDFSGIGNRSTVALESFYWRDTLPVSAVRLDKIVTGTYNSVGTYKVLYRTNLTGANYRTMYDNLSTQKNYVLDASPAALGLASNEYITEFTVVFGVVPAGFSQVTAPQVYCNVLPGLSGGVQFTNTADAGGVYDDQWIQAVSRWVTKVYGPTKPLPVTGY